MLILSLFFYGYLFLFSYTSDRVRRTTVETGENEDEKRPQNIQSMMAFIIIIFFLDRFHRKEQQLDRASHTHGEYNEENWRAPVGGTVSSRTFCVTTSSILLINPSFSPTILSQMEESGHFFDWLVFTRWPECFLHRYKRIVWLCGRVDDGYGTRSRHGVGQVAKSIEFHRLPRPLTISTDSVVYWKPVVTDDRRVKDEKLESTTFIRPPNIRPVDGRFCFCAPNVVLELPVR